MSELKSAVVPSPDLFEPPQACVNRVIKSVLPDNVQITKEARAAFTRAAGIFIFYLTHCANDVSKDNKRQTIYASDVISAIKELDFNEFEKPLQEFLSFHRKEIETKKGPKDSSNATSQSASKGKSKKSLLDEFGKEVAGGGSGGGAGGGALDEEDDEEEDEEEEGDQEGDRDRYDEDGQDTGSFDP